MTGPHVVFVLRRGRQSGVGERTYPNVDLLGVAPVLDAAQQKLYAVCRYGRGVGRWSTGKARRPQFDDGREYYHRTLKPNQTHLEPQHLAPPDALWVGL